MSDFTGWLLNKLDQKNVKYSFRANDGGYYTPEQYLDARNAVRVYLIEREWTVEETSISEIAGSVSGIAHRDGYGRRGFTFYMRDLTRGVVREDGADDYFDAVRAAGVV